MCGKLRPALTPAEINARYSYNPRTGIVLHNTDGRRHKRYTPAGRQTGKHRYMSVGGANFRTDSVIWYMQTGDWVEIEHDNGDPLDMRLDNLRPTARREERELERLHVIFYPDRLEITTTLPEATQNALRDLLEPFVTSWKSSLHQG